MEHRHNTSTSDSSTNIFLTGAILFANLDSSGLAEYALKAAIGGLIWVAFKVAGDYVSRKIHGERSRTIKNRKQK